jgi:hypothetical protein
MRDDERTMLEGLEESWFESSLEGWLTRFLPSASSGFFEFGNLNANPHVFRPPGSGSIFTTYGSGSGSFYNQTKIAMLRIRSGIRCLFDPWIRDPGSGMGKK